ncbi:hypothetical protein K474DRAFT_1760323 [Panus rudis PR-1116 ss-1]|nr:hypothetical protein K474DRAFT_1760323 [Panus rudis PR-1116 ss-1]
MARSSEPQASREGDRLHLPTSAFTPNIPGRHYLFYGTLIHPSILRRVIGHEGNQLYITPGLLFNHTRHKIKNADYPGVLPYSSSAALFNGRELSPEEKTVRGTIVSGLTTDDIALLDIFEGDEYSREVVSVHPLGPFVPLASTAGSDSAIIPTTPPEIPSHDGLQPAISAQTYIWKDSIARLEPELWEFAQFVRDNAWKWVGSGSANNEDYDKVDKRRAMNGRIVRTEIVVDADGTQKVQADRE